MSSRREADAVDSFEELKNGRKSFLPIRLVGFGLCFSANMTSDLVVLKHLGGEYARTYTHGILFASKS